MIVLTNPSPVLLTLHGPTLADTSHPASHLTCRLIDGRNSMEVLRQGAGPLDSVRSSPTYTAPPALRS